MKKRPFSTLVLGIGNILLKDEGVGIRVIEYLHKCPLPENVELFDGGLVKTDIIEILSNRQHVIIIDAAELDAPAGTVLKITPKDWLNEQEKTPSLHDLDIPQTLAMAHLRGCAPRNVVCLAVAPESVEPGMELSDTLKPLVPKIADMVLEEIQSINTGHD